MHSSEAQDRNASVRDISVESSNDRKFALLIGIDDYVGFTKLQGAKRDVELLRDSLYKIGFEKENVYCLVCGGTLEESTSRENIMKTIDTVLERTRPGDLVFLAMSGHGIQLEKKLVYDSNVSDKTKNDPKSVLQRFCPIDTSATSVEKLLATTISIMDIYEKVTESQATYKLILIDACRNSPGEELFANTRSASPVLAKSMDFLPPPPKGITLLQSCSKGQQSFEDPEFKRGIFTHYFVEGIFGKAADKDGKVRLLGLANYATTNTEQRLDYLREQGRTRNKDDKQVPFLSGEMTNFTFVDDPPPDTPVKPREGMPLNIDVNGVEYTFCWCPAGNFTMGSPKEELGRSFYEKQYQVTLTHGFWMQETEVTQDMWESVMGSNPSHAKDSKTLPVESISWNDCQQYIQKLNRMAVASVPLGYKFSLPTEAQWEYACRAGTTTALNNGKNLADEKFNCASLEEVGVYNLNDWMSKPSEVKSKKANVWGLHDMHGNVHEWCLDWYGSYPEGSVADPVGAIKGSGRVIRGGSWKSAASECRSASRDPCPPSDKKEFLGVRLALVYDK